MMLIIKTPDFPSEIRKGAMMTCDTCSAERRMLLEFAAIWRPDCPPERVRVCLDCLVEARATFEREITGGAGEKKP